MTHYNREDVDRRLARLRETYDPLVERETAELPPEEFDRYAADAGDGYTGGGYAWVVREEPPPLSASMPDVEEAYPRVLLALVRGTDGWSPAGGGRESEATTASTSDGDSRGTGGETYEEAAVREVREETGVECEIVDCRRVRRTALERSGDGDGERDVVHTLWVFFAARETGGSIDVQESELDGAAWFHDPPAALHWSVEDHPWSWAEWEES